MGNRSEFSAAVVALVVTIARTTSTTTTETLPSIATMATTSSTASTVTATSRPSGETMDPAAVLVERPHPAGDAAGFLRSSKS
jgi:hypothetical protein